MAKLGIINDIVLDERRCDFSINGNCNDVSDPTEQGKFEKWFEQHLFVEEDAKTGDIKASFDSNEYKDFLIKELDIKHPVNITADKNLPEGTYGGTSYHFTKNGDIIHDITISTADTEHPDDLANTIAHEMKHAKDNEPYLEDLRDLNTQINEKDEEIQKIGNKISKIDKKINNLDNEIAYNDSHRIGGMPLSQEERYKKRNLQVEKQLLKIDRNKLEAKEKILSDEKAQLEKEYSQKKITHGIKTTIHNNPTQDDVYKYGESAEEAFRKVYNEKKQKLILTQNPQTTNQQPNNYLGNHMGKGAGNNTPYGTNGINYGNPSVNPGFAGFAGFGAYRGHGAAGNPHEQGGFGSSNGGPAVNASSESLGELMQVIKNEAAEFDNIKKSIEQDLKNSISWWDDMKRDEFVTYYNQNSEPRIASVIGELIKTAKAVNNKREDIIKYQAVKY
ncbi:MAG: hypothetical protein IKW83_11220 [Muribaculaceae bacterium]|nr:hypothetical protein [Muribaculaceae bacterium]